MTFPDVVSTATLLDASIDSVTVTNGGSGYLSAPTITAQGGNGINAELNAIIVNQGVRKYTSRCSRRTIPKCTNY